MSDALYERYKEALRRAHVAAGRGRSDAALEAYGEAVRIAPDRALPLVGIGTVLARLGKDAEALAAFDAALERAPADEAALRGRAAALTALGRRAEAAVTLDRLMVRLSDAGLLPEAADVAREALELAESRGRRRGLAGLVERLRGPGDDPLAQAALERASALLARGVVVPPPPGVVIDESVADAAAVGSEPAPPAVPPPPPPPPFDAVRATADLETAVESGNADLARAAALDAAVGHRAAGHANAAIDACYLALASNPADPGLHLALAEIYLDRGWRAAATDKLLLLARLAELTDDPATRERLCAIATERLPEEVRLTGLCA
jgi:tetratricopeptide (TPR) repeat protein